MEVIDATSTILMAAKEHGLNATHFLAVAQCEDPGLIPDKQSDYVYKGRREPSFGVFQIDADYHPEIPIASSTDVLWASEWAATEWEQGHASSWSCYRYLSSRGW